MTKDPDRVRIGTAERQATATIDCPRDGWPTLPILGIGLYR
ncbi:hypothetical protein ACTXG7_07455 [Mycolicibacterium sp. Dal123E01]